MVRVSVEPAAYQEVKPWILTKHYARRMPCVQYAFKLLSEGRVVGIVTYGQPASPWLCKGVAGDEYRKRVIELNRLVVASDAPKNAASILVGRSLRQLPKGLFVVSYADAGGWNHVGYVYQATNFLYTGMTKKRTDIYSESGHSRHHCGDTTKRQLRTAKHRYITVTGNGSCKAHLVKLIRYPVLPYPKGESRRYDVDNPIPVEETLLS